jgi:two-component system sensor histidine kinase/response regulator
LYDYMSKPIQSGELARVLAWAAAGAPAATETPTAAPTSAPTPTAAPPTNRPAALDRRGAVKQLGGDEELFVEIATLFLDDAPQVLASLRAALAAGDAKVVQRTAHTLKGSAGCIGGMPLAAAAAKVEALGAAGTLADAPAATDVLAAELDRLLTELAAALAPAAAGARA